MNKLDIKNLLQAQTEMNLSFNNFHGITIDNLSSFTVEPYTVIVEPDDLETMEREMWIILNPSSDVFVAYDPLQNGWSIIETWKEKKYIQVVSGDTLAEALDGM